MALAAIIVALAVMAYNFSHDSQQVHLENQ
jgi:hypothetical protein